MNIWSTFRHVPPVTTHAIAVAIVAFATYLAAVEFPPSVWSHAMDPIALAVSVKLLLLTLGNVLTPKFVRSFAQTPLTICIIAAALVLGVLRLAIFGSAAAGVAVFVSYYLIHAAILVTLLKVEPDGLANVQATWTHLIQHRHGAVMLEASGVLVCAAALLSVWTFASPLAFAVMMTSGVMLMRVLINWIIVLYLLDAERRTR